VPKRDGQHLLQQRQQSQKEPSEEQKQQEQPAEDTPPTLLTTVGAMFGARPQGAMESKPSSEVANTEEGATNDVEKGVGPVLEGVGPSGAAGFIAGGTCQQPDATDLVTIQPPELEAPRDTTQVCGFVCPGM